jgi:hypothetical protein
MRMLQTQSINRQADIDTGAQVGQFRTSIGESRYVHDDYADSQTCRQLSAQTATMPG